MEFLKRLDEQIVDGKPHRATPIGVAAEEPADRFARLIVDPVLFAVEHRDDRGARRAPRETADAVRREEFRWSSMTASTLRKRCSSTTASRRRPCSPGRAMSAQSCGRSPAGARETTRAAGETRGGAGGRLGSSVSTAKRGMSPTIERILSGMRWPSGSVQDVVVEAVVFAPQSPSVFSALAM